MEFTNTDKPVVSTENTEENWRDNLVIPNKDNRIQTEVSK
jgi:RNA polymerase subunit RPABC4/transcription elongation factor Spt4